MRIKRQSKKLLNEAVRTLKNGGVILFPTDTVYGFLADAINKKAVEKIYKIKNRPKSKPLAVFVKDIKMAKELAEIDEPAFAKGLGEARQEKLLIKKWPGKYTFVLKRKKTLKLYDGGKNTIALRIPKHKLLNDLLKKINKPLVQTSANISGQPALTKSSDIIKVFEGQKYKPDLIISAGNLPKRNPSAIIDLTKDKINFLRR
ncbi:MAG: L-threonylcarbamoyladenylate synthase [Candidatus Staskawiczbacteria bacterium]|nr:L-threonylcarbamoyladenylate synthase [Candidatus Staskawiczbacteria bacterium]